MDGRILLVPADSPILDHDSTKIITRYPSDEVLVSTEAPSGETDDEQAPHGLVLEGIDNDNIMNARREPAAVTAEARAKPQEYLAYVELAGPTQNEWLETLKSHDVQPLRFQPLTCYLSRGTRAAFEAVSALDFVISVTPLVRSIKPSLVLGEAGHSDAWVVVEGSADAGELISLLQELDDVAIISDDIDTTDQIIRVPVTFSGSDAAEEVLAHPMVLAIEERSPIRLEDEVAGLILAGQYTSQGRPTGRYLDWLRDQGITGRGVTIGIVDNGVDESHDAYSGRVTSRDGNRREWHGTFVAGHAAGNYLQERDRNGFIYGVGMAPAAGLISQYNQNGTRQLCEETATTAAPNGAEGTIQNNSWGAGTHNPMDYRSMESRYDEMARNATPESATARPLTICFSAGNSGTSGLTRPKAAKNVIVTGNSENYRPDVGGSESDNINQMYTGSHASSHGNCGDGRVRPHVVAPGEWTASANFDSHPGQQEYISPKLTWGGGTSGASPKTAGACALLTQWWRDHNGGETPSPAMLRALVVNGAEDMNFGGPIPNARQGWGRLNLANVLSRHVHHTYVDQSIILQHRGEQRNWRLRATDPSMPVRITLTWTDPPGPLNSGTSSVPAVVNYLGLRVTVNGQTYYGNNFRNGFSTPGPLPEPDKEGWDNLQNVYLSPGTVRETFEVVVRGLNITTDCFGRASSPQQDFALVITNGFIDTGSSPSDIFIVIDDASSGTNTTVDDHWDSSDDDSSDDDWWSDTDDATDSAENRPTLRRGDRGDDVKDLQQLLIDAGYLRGKADGIFGSGTATAVRSFQRDNGLTADGVVGTSTWRALLGTSGSNTGTNNGTDDSSGSTTDRPTLRRGDRGDDVRDLQQLLIDAGYLTGNADGIYGSGTVDAVRSFQRGNGLTADGVAGPSTWEALINQTSSSGDDWSSDDDDSSDDDWWDGDFWDDWGESDWETNQEEEAIQIKDEQERDGELDTITTEILKGLSANAGEVGILMPDTAFPEHPSEETSPGGVNPILLDPTRFLIQPVVDNDNLDEMSSHVRDAAGSSLREALDNIMHNWDRWTATGEDGVARRKVALIVVGQHTRVSAHDIAILRRLAMHGELYIICTLPTVANLLGQKIKRIRGVHFRIPPPLQLKKTIRRVLAEALGAQEIVLHYDGQQDEDGAGYTSRIGFHLTELDSRAVLEFPIDGELKVRMASPEGKEFTLTVASRRQGIKLTKEHEFYRLEVNRMPEKPWVGAWKLLIQAPEGTEAIEPLGWVWSDIELGVIQPAIQPAGTPNNETQLTVEGRKGSRLSMVSMEVSSTGDDISSETQRRPVQKRPTASRLSRLDEPSLHTNGTESHRDEEVTSSSIDFSIAKNGKKDQCQVTELVMEVNGVTAEGSRFSRRIRSSVIDPIDPAAEREQRIARREAPVIIEASVARVHYADTGAIKGLTLRRADGATRPVKIGAQALSDLLPSILEESDTLHFVLSGVHVLRVFRLLPVF